MSLFDENFKAFNDWKWVNYDGNKEMALRTFIDNHTNCKFYIGSDSQKHATKKRGVKHWKFITCLVAHTQRTGGNVIMSSEIVNVPSHLSGRLQKEERLPVLRQRLLHEATRSLHMAWYLNEIIDCKNIEVHVDVNSNLKWDSARYKDEVVGYVTSQGFECKHKPEAWAASWIADGKC